MSAVNPANENTYRLPSDVFPVSAVKAAVDKVLLSCFSETTYEQLGDIPECIKKTINAIKSDLETNRVIQPRFKYAVQLIISEKIGQAFFTGAMCLWDPEHDNYVSCTYETSTFTAVATVFGCLLE